MFEGVGEEGQSVVQPERGGVGDALERAFAAPALTVRRI